MVWTVPTTPPVTTVVVVVLELSGPAAACWLLQAASRTASAVSATGTVSRLRGKDNIEDLGSGFGRPTCSDNMEPPWFQGCREPENEPIESLPGLCRRYWRGPTVRAIAALRPLIAMTLPPGCVEALQR